jgi:hypothetical protein
MAGGFSFSKRNWSASSWATFYVMRFLASRVTDASTRENLTELIENNIPMLDLRSPDQAPLVDILANDLPLHAPDIEDKEVQQSLAPVLDELIQCAREQQKANH